jgi:diguanylate cyclase (GGDEF)-like protein
MGGPQEWGSPGRRVAVLVTATVVSLAVTFLGGYLTRLSIIETSAWVAHTHEVKVAIDECQLALGRDDGAALARAEDRIDTLTADNPREQQNVARAVLLSERGERRALADVFTAMQLEEDRLLVERVERAATARTRSLLVFACGALLSLAFGVGVLGMLRARSRDLEDQRRLLEAIIESVDEGIIAVSPSQQIVAINAAARAFWGNVAPREDWPEDWRPLLRATNEDGSDMPPDQGPLARAMRGETTHAIVYRITAPGDSPNGGTWISASARPIRDPSGRTIAAVTTLRDITAQRAYAERLRDQSLTDELTGLLNRRGFMTMAAARFDAMRKSRLPVALLYADVNGLKPINDGLGHAQGDRAIKDAAQVVKSIFREGDLVARIGGDEFVAFLPNFTPSAREPFLERLAAATRSYAERAARPFRLSLSADLTFVDWDDPPSLEALLAAADRKMYERKRERAVASVLRLSVAPSKDSSP